MNETRIIGRLPQLDVEILAGRDEAAGSEWVTVRLRAVPSFEAAARLFDPTVWWQLALACNPWSAWWASIARLPRSKSAALPEPATGEDPASALGRSPDGLPMT